MENITQRVPAVDRSAEKLRLAKELQLTAYVNTKELLSMKFKTISTRQIHKMLGAGKTVILSKPRFAESVPIAIAMACMALVCTYTKPTHPNVLPTMHALAWVSVLVSLGCLLPCFLDQIACDIMPLNEWKDELPYGALLAVKEATQMGISKFAIWYPCLQSTRVLADPVITGIKNSERLEIFSWDDSKIYE